ncbi:hypothetical protein Csa_007083 [Cucumis sativus]|nr:hypothetical protein Csa_007083 [Cucumis sativus]
MDFLVTMIEPYRAVIKEEWKKVKEELKDETKIVFPMTASRDTALHLAVYSGGEEPLRTFLVGIFEMDEAFWRNSAGNTPLHEAATVGNLAAVKLLVEYKKEDLVAENIYGETPLFRAARCGHLEIVNYILEDCEDFFSRCSRHWTNRKGNPIIHAAIQSQKFDVVLKLTEFDKSLLEMTNLEGKTALHVLANMPSAFQSGYPMKFFESIIYNLLPTQDIYNYKYSNFGSSNNDPNGYSKSSIIQNKNEDLEAGISNSETPNKLCHSNCCKLVYFIVYTLCFTNFHLCFLYI